MINDEALPSRSADLLDHLRTLGTAAGPSHKPEICPDTGTTCVGACALSCNRFPVCRRANYPERDINDPTASALYEMAHQEYRDMKDGGQGSYSGFVQTSTLDYCASILQSAFHETCYQVGSSLETKKWRDVDVRMIMADDKFDRLFGTCSILPFWQLVCVAISEWMSKLSGLPVDFQIQKQSRANKYIGQRNALGMGYRLNIPAKDLPEWIVKGREDQYPDD